MEGTRIKDSYKGFWNLLDSKPNCSRTFSEITCSLGKRCLFFIPIGQSERLWVYISTLKKEKRKKTREVVVQEQRREEEKQNN